MRLTFLSAWVSSPVRFLVPALLLSFVSACFRDPEVGKITCNDNDGCPWGYACSTMGRCCRAANGTTCDNEDGSVEEVGATTSVDSQARGTVDVGPLDGVTLVLDGQNVAISDSKDAAILDSLPSDSGTTYDGEDGYAKEVGATTSVDSQEDTSDVGPPDSATLVPDAKDAAIPDAPLSDTGTPDVPITPSDANTSCTSPKIGCNGQCFDPTANECCLATDCTGTCMTCSTNHVCTTAKSQDDPSLHCAGTCDATGACKTKQGQTCKTATDCVFGFCADGYCCDSACNGSCQACNVKTSLGTCTTLPANTAPLAGHPPCTGTDICAAKCSGSPDCTFPPANTTCGTASCSASNVYQEAGTCNAGTCSLPSPKTCTNSACSVTATGGCTGACKPGDLGCGSTTTPQLCDSTGTWQNQTDCLPGFTCSGGSCACTATGKINCTTACTDLQSDSNNCGTCGHDCVGGACTSAACQPVAVTGALSTPPQVFGVDSQYVYYLVESPTTPLTHDAYRVSKTAVSGTPSFVTTTMVMGDFAGVIGSTIFQFDSGGVPSDMPIGSTFGYTPLALTSSGNWLAMWRSVPPRYYAQINADHSSIFSVSWYNLSNGLIATHSESTTGIAPAGGSVIYGVPPYAGGDSVYWVRSIEDSSYTVQSSALFTASVSNTTAIQMANSTSGSGLGIIDINAQSVLLSDGNNELFRVGLPATSSTASPTYVTTIGSINAVEGAQGIYFIDDAYMLYRCSPGNCVPTKARLATDQPTQVQAHISSTLYQDDSALYWGRSSTVTGTGANQIMRIAK